MKKHPIFIEYAIYHKNGELIDVLHLTKKQSIEYLKNNPEHTLEEMDDDLEEDDE